MKKENGVNFEIKNDKNITKVIHHDRLVSFKGNIQKSNTQSKSINRFIRRMKVVMTTHQFDLPATMISVMTTRIHVHVDTRYGTVLSGILKQMDISPGIFSNIDFDWRRWGGMLLCVY